MVPFRILSLPPPHPNRFYAVIQRLPSGSSPTSHRKLSASLRRASGKDAATPCGATLPIRHAPWEKTPKKGPQKDPKMR